MILIIKQLQALFILLAIPLILNAQDHNIDSQEAKEPWGEIDVKAITDVFGRQPDQKTGFNIITFPRTDLTVKVDNYAIEPGLALTSWLAFLPMGNESMLMGDMVLQDKELGPVIKKIKENGLSIAAIHNHLIGESPAIIYMHVTAMGNAGEIAKKMKEAFSVTGTPLNPTKKSATGQEINWGNVEQVIGAKATKDGNLLKFGIARKDKIVEHGVIIPKTYGIHTVINFQMLDNKKAAITGDFVLLAEEVNPVIGALTANGITVTALHNHMMFEQPRLFFMHFWAVDDPEKLANGLKKALNVGNFQFQ